MPRMLCASCLACYVIVPRFLASMPAGVLINKVTIAEA